MMRPILAGQTQRPTQRPMQRPMQCPTTCVLFASYSPARSRRFIILCLHQTWKRRKTTAANPSFGVSPVPHHPTRSAYPTWNVSRDSKGRTSWIGYGARIETRCFILTLTPFFRRLQDRRDVDARFILYVKARLFSQLEWVASFSWYHISFLDGATSMIISKTSMQRRRRKNTELKMCERVLLMMYLLHSILRVFPSPLPSLPLDFPRRFSRPLTGRKKMNNE